MRLSSWASGPPERHRRDGQKECFQAYATAAMANTQPRRQLNAPQHQVIGKVNASTPPSLL